jgi:hypothetical protein
LLRAERRDWASEDWITFPKSLSLHVSTDPLRKIHFSPGGRLTFESASCSATRR